MALLSGGALAGCGFKLREAPRFAFSSVAVPGKSRLAVLVRRQLGIAGTVEIVPDTQVETAQAVVEIQSEGRDRAIVSTTAAGGVREMALQLNVRFRVRRPGGGADWLGPTLISQSRDISFNETAALAKEGEEALLYRDMETDISQQMIRRLSAIK